MPVCSWEVHEVCHVRRITTSIMSNIKPKFSIHFRPPLYVPGLIVTGILSSNHHSPFRYSSNSGASHLKYLPDNSVFASVANLAIIAPANSGLISLPSSKSATNPS
jgi:hypothetical protein